ncbi:MAG: hypothetical protein L3J47_03670 [Sulfurovum sp.]|nr:hypothetical protein [Sulfurovum sp.]
MRHNNRRFFHKVIIASLCCMALAGCGHKTSVVYVPDDAPQAKQTTPAN